MSWLAMPTPTVVGAVPDAHAEITKDAAFSFDFSAPMAHAAVERAFSVTPKISGAFSWQGNRLTFDPATSLEKGATFRVTISKGARTWAFKGLASPFTQEFFVKDDPEITVLAPTDGATIRPAQTLTVLFDRPMRELSGSLAVPELLVIEPALKGEYHWQGTSGFEFVPSEGWAPESSYAVRLAKDVTFMDGTVLKAGAGWKYSTPNLKVETSNLDSKLDPGGAIRLSFNYPVPAAAVRDAVAIHERSMPGVGQPGQPSEPVLLSKSGLTFVIDKDAPNTILIRKVGGFHLGSRYDFTLPQGFTGGLGPNGLVEVFSAGFSMDELGFRILGSCPENAGKMQTGDAFLIGINNPPDQAILEKSVTVSPAVSDFHVTANGWYRKCSDSPWPQQLEVTGRWKASTAYTVTVLAGFHDQYDQPLGNAVAYTVTTEPYHERADLSGFGGFGLLASNAPRVFQVRTLNMSKPIVATLCGVSVDAYIRLDASGCRPLGSKAYDTKANLNDFKVLNIDLNDIVGRSLPAGTYELSLEIPDTEAQGGVRHDSRFLAISDTALTVKRDNAGKTVVWANDMKTGEVVGNVPVTVMLVPYAGGSSQKSNGKTGTDGLATIQTPAGGYGDIAAVAADGAHFGIGMVSWSDGISAWNFNLSSTYPVLSDVTHIGYLHTDRMIYRPDQLVYFKGVIRKDIDAALQIPDEKEVEVVFKDANGTDVGTQKLPVSTFGTFNGSFQLDPSMPLGTYSFSVAIQGQAIIGTFDVRAYRRPDFKVTLTAPDKAVTSGDTARMPLHVEYYYGTPLAGARVDYVVTRRPSFFQPLMGDWYSFTESDDSYCYWYCRTQEEVENVKNGSAVLDADGNFTIAFPVSLNDYRANATYAVTATVTDINQRQVSANTSFDAQKADFMLGIRPDPTQSWGAADAAFDLIALDAAGHARSGAAGSVKFFKRTWSSVRKTGSTGETVYDWTHVDTPAGSASFTTDKEGKAHVTFSPDSDGEFVALAKAVDGRGRSVSASVSRWVDRGHGASVRVSDDHVMKIIQDKASYEVGDVASLVVQSPYTQSKGLVTVERDHLRSARVVDLSSATRIIKVPITDDMAPNIYVSVLAVQGGGDVVPDFRLGYADLQVNTTKKVLSMKVEADKSLYRPGDTVTLSLTTNKSDGSPASAEVSVAVVDERVVALLGSIDKNILGRFWFPRSLGVATGQSITRLIKKLFVETQGGGGGKGGDDGSTALRGNFLDTAYWKADVVTDSHGKAQMSFKLPDNLTRWQVLAIGTTKDTIVGSAETALITRRDLMIEPLLPRIMRKGDTAVFGATVSNLTDKPIEALVAMSIAGATSDDVLTKHVSLAANDRKPVSWTVRAPMDSEKIEVEMTAVGGGLSDGFKNDLPVLGFAVPETVQVSNLFGRSASEKLVIPDGILPDAGQVKLRVASSVGSGLQDSVRYLLDYEYGCSEQTSSALLGALIHERLVKAKLAAGDEALIRQAHAKVEAAIKILSSSQKADGGWSFWSDGDRTYPFLTAYTYWVLSQAEQAGYGVDHGVMERAGAYLKNVLAYPVEGQDPGLSANERAQVLLSLADHDAKDLSGYAQTSYEKRSLLSTYGKSFLAMALVKIDGNTTRAKGIMEEMKSQVVYIDPSTAYVSENEGYDDYFMSSDVRSTALYLQALMRVSPKDDDADRLMRYLMGKKGDGHWISTQETAQTLSGLLAYVERHPIDTMPLDVKVSLDHALAATLHFENGDLSSERSVTFPIKDLKAKGDEHLFEIQKDSEKRYFYDLSMTVSREVDKIAPFDNGFTVMADIYALDDPKHLHPLSEAPQGATVRVHMKALVPKEHRYVSFEYHLPAGLEAIDSSLRTSPQNVAGETMNCAPGWWGEQVCVSDWEQGWWWENAWRHIELRDDRVFLFSDDLQPGIYEYDFLASAVTPGTFSVPPARAYEFYHPQANGHAAGRKFRVIAK